MINQLYLPRYGLANYLKSDATALANAGESRVMDNLSRAGKRLLGYCRTNLFKRLESGGHAFILSLDRHILRNFIVQHALQQGLPVPVGTQNAEMLDPANNDADAEAQTAWDADDEEGNSSGNGTANGTASTAFSAEAYRQRAAQVYALYQTQYAHNFDWLRPLLFEPRLKTELEEDSRQLIGVLQTGGVWDAGADRKLQILHRLITRTHPNEKVLVFTQFADTVDYLTAELKRRGVSNLEGVSGNSDDPTGLAWRFSPKSNSKGIRRGRGAARAGGDRRPERRPEPAGRGHRRELRSALGHHPPDPARRARRPHRPDQRKKSFATRSCPPRASSRSSGCGRASGSGCTKTRR